MISSRGEKEYRIYTETQGHGTIYSGYYTKTEAVKTAKALAREYPESYFEVYHEYSERKVWKGRKPKNNPGKLPKNKWVKAKAIKINKNGSISVKR